MNDHDPGNASRDGARAPPSTDTERRFTEALALHKRGRVGDAEVLYRAILTDAPRHVGALQLLGVAEFQRGRHAEAERLINQALMIEPASAAAHFNLANVLFAQRRLPEALSSYDRAIECDPNDADMHSNRGIVLHALRRIDEALASYDRALALDPRHAQALVNRGIALHALRRFNIALDSYDRALAVAPNNVEALFNRGFVLDSLARYDEALASYDRAVALNPDLAEGWVGRGNILHNQRRHHDALAAFDRALAIKHDVPGAWLGRGNTLCALGRHQDALAAYEQALAAQPQFAEAWNGRGNVLFELRRLDEASTAYDNALSIEPNLVEAWVGRGNVLNELGRPDPALAAYDRALAIKADLASAWHGRASIHYKCKRYTEAVACEDRALALRADYADACANRGNSLKELGDFTGAIASYDRALVLDPDIRYVPGLRLNARLGLCDWSDIDAECARIASLVQANCPATMPFLMLAVDSSPSVQHACARLYTAKNFPATADSAWRGPKYAHDRIRIAYVSGDLREHAVTALTAGLFEHHDRDRFEITAVSLTADTQDAMNMRLRRAFDRYVNVHDQSDADVVALLRRLEIDIAVDLTGHTGDARTGIFAARAAPVQVNYLGFPATMGAGYFDYIIADAFVAPLRRQDCFSERIVHLPDTFQANDAKRPRASAPPSRVSLGLPDRGFVFCCFNNSYKIRPAIFDVWMRLLHRVDGSVLWLLDSNPHVPQNLRREATARGIGGERLVFARRAPYADYIARYQAADVFLDTLPFGGGTTTSDALWSGLPVITCPGESFASRMSGSLLRALGMPEMIAGSLEDYEALALRLACDADFCSAIKEKLAHNRTTYPLFDTRRFTRHLEKAFTMMWQRCQRGEPCAGFAVEAIDDRTAADGIAAG